MHGLLRPLPAYFCHIAQSRHRGELPPTLVDNGPNLNPLSWIMCPAFNPPLNHDTDHFICLTRFLPNSFVKCLYLVILIVLAFLFVWLCFNLAIMIFFKVYHMLWHQEIGCWVSSTLKIFRGQLLSKTQHL